MNSERRCYHPCGLVPLLVIVIVAGGCSRHRSASPPERPPAAMPTHDLIEPVSLRHMTCPTDRKSLIEWEDTGAFQPTASGRTESALYGSVRTEKIGKELVPAFHEGIDIAPVNCDARGRPLDSVYAVADGIVAYINRLAGNSSYGKYVVLIHAGSPGDLYTLYAHLSEIAPGLNVGQPVMARHMLGTMGNTSSLPIPMSRAHLHFEIGLIGNSRYDRWYKAQKLKPDHGNFNGGNLLGINPLAVFQRQQENPDFDFVSYFETIPGAFELVLAIPRQPDFFQRYPRLWKGTAFRGRGLIMTVSENGLPLQGGNASESDVQNLGKRQWRVRNVNTEVLGRNGCRLIVCHQGTWTLSQGGERWLESLIYK